MAMIQVAIGREAADLVFLEVNRHKAHFFVSVRKDCTVSEVKDMLLNVIVEPRTSRLELYRQYPMNGEKYTKLNDTSALTTCGFQPDTATPDRPAVLVLTIGDEEPEAAVMSARQPQVPEVMEFMGYVARSNKRRNGTQNEMQVSYANYCVCQRPGGTCRCEPPKKVGVYAGSYQASSPFHNN
uniref:Ubiquitin-like domain-containing protein n=1 Tax=Panagrellus redivivus TaxID=6233 RepID=A0A7E4V478_PANRE